MHLPRLLNISRRRRLAWLVIIGLGQAAASVAIALTVRYAFDAWFLSSIVVDLLSVGALATMMIVIGCFSAWLRVRERIEAERLGQGYAYSVRMCLYDCLGSFDSRTLQARSRGGNLLRFIGDLTALRQWVSQGLARLLVVGVTSVGAVTAMALINLRLAAGVAIVIGAGVLLTLHAGGRMQSAVRESRRRRAYLATNINEKITAMPVVQMFGQIRRERARLAWQSRRLRDAMIERARAIGRLRGIVEATGVGAVALTLTLGASEFHQGRASAGTVVAAMTVLGMLMPAIRDLGRVHEYWHGYAVAREKLSEFLAVRPQVFQVGSPGVLETPRGDIEFRDVSVAGVLRGVRCHAKPGARIVIAGPNGSGKSTLLNLVARMLDPDEGQILIDGQDVSGLALESIRQAVGMVSPDLCLLRGTIERNLRYRWPDAPDEDVTQVSRLCGIEPMLDAMPLGGQTRVAEGGANLSVGQRQRIALARALLGAPPILLLDEADANLDADSRRVLNAALAQYEGTVLFVSHHPERIALADIVWRIEDERLIEEPIVDNHHVPQHERAAA